MKMQIYNTDLISRANVTQGNCKNMQWSMYVWLKNQYVKLQFQYKTIISAYSFVKLNYKAPPEMNGDINEIHSTLFVSKSL